MNLYSNIMKTRVVDSHWVRRSFLMSRKIEDPKEKLWELKTSANEKFTSTRLGGNFAINPPPQWTRYADLKVSGLNTAARKQPGVGTLRGEELGMGRKYSETIDDYAQVINLQFGVPEYNGMVSFFTGFFDGDASLLASEGRSTISYKLGRVAGTILTVATVIAFPWLMIGFTAINATFRFLMSSPTSKYYYMRPTMELYWNRVNYILNSIAVNMGIVPRVTLPLVSNKKPIVTDDSQDAEFSPEYNRYMHELAPDIFLEGGGIDIYAVSNRAQRIADQRAKELQEIIKADMTNQERANAILAHQQKKSTDPGGDTIEAALNAYHNSPSGNVENRRNDPAGNRLNAKADVTSLEAEQTPGKEKEAVQTRGNSPQMRDSWTYSEQTGTEQAQERSKGWWEQFSESYMANRRDAHQFLTLQVNSTGSVQESFSNSTKESDISSKVNGFSSSSRSARFSFSEGNTGIEAIDAVKSSIAGFASGVLDSIHMSGLLSLAGSAFVDIPKHYESSSAQFPTASYSINLRTWSGDKISQLINLYVPLCCLLGAALPLSTGKQSYTAPFLCKLYSRGRNTIQLGMITSLSITRGVGSLPWNNNGQCLGIDISFEVANLSSVMHAPIDTGSSYFDLLLRPWKRLVDDDSAFTDYMAVLGNLSLADQFYPKNKLLLNLTRKKQAYATAFTPAAISNLMDDTWGVKYLGYAIGAFARATERGL